MWMGFYSSNIRHCWSSANESGDQGRNLCQDDLPTKRQGSVRRRRVCFRRKIHRHWKHRPQGTWLYTVSPWQHNSFPMKMSRARFSASISIGFRWNQRRSQNKMSGEVGIWGTLILDLFLDKSNGLIRGVRTWNLLPKYAHAWNLFLLYMRIPYGNTDPMESKCTCWQMTSRKGCPW